MSWLPGARTTGPCLGDVAAALIDGELSHAERERAHRHLTHCPACRAEVEAERQLKLRLHGLAPAPALGELLSARLLAVGSSDALSRRTSGVPGSRRDATQTRDARPRARSPLSRSSSGRSPLSRSSSGRSPLSRSSSGRSPRSRSSSGRSPLRRRTLGSAAVVALGLTAAFAFGGGSEPPSTTVDPGIGAFVTEYVVSTDGLAPALQANLTAGGGAPTGR